MRRLALTAFLVIAFATGVHAAWEHLPPISQQVPIQDVELEVDAGQTWAKQVAVPSFSDTERPVLALRARVQTPPGGGCNVVLQVLLDGVPLTESLLRPRLLNKPADFDPPGTQYHFQWYSATHQGWMTIFNNTYDGNWGGTGRDFEFLFDLTGLVENGQPTTLSFVFLNPIIPKALKLDRAPLVVDRVTLGVMNAADVDRLRSEVLKGQALRPVVVEPALPPDAKPGERAYEVVWSGRKEFPPAQVAFDDLTGWTASVRGDANVALAASVEHLLWRDRVAKLSYGGGTTASMALLRPPQPIPISETFDAVNLWLYSAADRMKDRRLHFVALLEDNRGREFQIDLGSLTSGYWNLLHGVVDAKAAVRLRFPAKFTALLIENCNVPDAQRAVYLESLTFYQQNRKPFATLETAGRAVFPTSDDGVLPTPPKNVKTSVSQLPDGAEFAATTPDSVLRFRVRPAKGCLHGISAQWNDGPEFRPADGGGITLDALSGSPESAVCTATKLKGESLTARWRLTQGTSTAEWDAVYSVRGRTLVVDVKCGGGSATGLAYGQVAGLPNPRGIEVPYLIVGGGRGLSIGCAAGLFVSLLPDWYHSDFSGTDATTTSPDGDRIDLMKGTTYTPLTNGRRNDLRERLLITVSPEFADTLPGIPNPPSPNRERLAPYAFYMGRASAVQFYTTLKRYGIDHLIASDFAAVLIDDYSEGFAGRWRPHPLLTYEKVQEFRHAIHSLGYMFSFYIDATDYFPLNEWFDENKVSLKLDGDLCEGWYGNFIIKPNAMPWLVRKVGERVKEHYAADCVYLDVHTNRRLQALDFEAGVEGAGMARPQVLGNADCILEARKWYGSTVSEGICRWLYAGVCDMDYASYFTPTPMSEIPPLVDFDLLKIHPLEHGTMMGYGPAAFFGQKNVGGLNKDPGHGAAVLDFYRYVSASLAYGHMLILGYGYAPPLSRFIHYYAIMQGVQREYLTDTAAEISYHNGTDFLPTSRALAEDSQKLGRVRVRYSRGLVVHVNYNAETPWIIEADGRRFELPPFGWLIVKPGEILAYSALIDGRRADFVKCPEYIYLNPGEGHASEAPLETNGAVWLKRDAPATWRLIPCGNLGTWKISNLPGLTHFCTDQELTGTPADRGCKRIVLDTKALLGKQAGELRITARDETGQTVAANTKNTDDGRLEIIPDAAAVDYLLQPKDE